MTCQKCFSGTDNFILVQKSSDRIAGKNTLNCG